MLYNLRTSELLWGYVFRPNKNLMICYNTLLELSVITEERRLAQPNAPALGEYLVMLMLGLLCLRLICLRGSNLLGDVFMPNRGRSMLFDCLIPLFDVC